MAYDEVLAHRIRELLATEDHVSEKQMFGGLAFLVGGKIAITVSSRGGVLVRIRPEENDHLLRTTRAETAVMRGSPMHGWLRVAPEHLTTKRQLRRWVQLGTECACSLPMKPSRRGK